MIEAESAFAKGSDSAVAEFRLKMECRCFIPFYIATGVFFAAICRMDFDSYRMQLNVDLTLLSEKDLLKLLQLKILDGQALRSPVKGTIEFYQQRVRDELKRRQVNRFKKVLENANRTRSGGTVILYWSSTLLLAWIALGYLQEQKKQNAADRVDQSTLTALQADLKTLASRVSILEEQCRVLSATTQPQDQPKPKNPPQ